MEIYVFRHRDDFTGWVKWIVFNAMIQKESWRYFYFLLFSFFKEMRMSWSTMPITGQCCRLMGWGLGSITDKLAGRIVQWATGALGHGENRGKRQRAFSNSLCPLSSGKTKQKTPPNLLFTPTWTLQHTCVIYAQISMLARTLIACIKSLGVINPLSLIQSLYPHPTHPPTKLPTFCLLHCPFCKGHKSTIVGSHATRMQY